MSWNTILHAKPGISIDVFSIVIILYVCCVVCVALQVLVFSHTVIAIDQRSRLVLEEFPTDRILHCGTTSKTLGTGSSAFPLLAFVSSPPDALGRVGHVIATKDDKLKHDVMRELEKVCLYLVARSATLSSPHGHPPRDAGLSPDRRTHAVRFVGRCLVDGADKVTRAWLTAMLRTREMPPSEVVLLMTRESVRFVEPLTQNTMHENPTRATTKVLWVPWAGARWTRTTAAGDLTAGAMRMTDEERVAVLRMVSTGQLTPDEAMDAVMRKEKSLTDVCLCYSWYNDTLGSTECVLFGCIEGKDKAEEMMRDLGYFRSQSRAKVSDKPESASSTPVHALDRVSGEMPRLSDCTPAAAHSTDDHTVVSPTPPAAEVDAEGDNDDDAIDDVCRMLAAMQAAMHETAEVD